MDVTIIYRNGVKESKKIEDESELVKLIEGKDIEALKIDDEIFYNPGKGFVYIPLVQEESKYFQIVNNYKP